VVAGLVPWLLTGWDVRSPPVSLQVVGGLLTIGGAAVLVHAFARFVREGLGTPAPVAPTEHLMVGGLLTSRADQAPTSRYSRTAARCGATPRWVPKW
jgi:hypothetical protein